MTAPTPAPGGAPPARPGARRSLIDALGGPRDAAYIGGAVLVVALALYMRHKATTSGSATTATTATTTTDPSQYQDPTALYGGYDQLQGEITALQQQQQAAGTSTTAAPLPTSAGSSTPAAPVPGPPKTAGHFPNPFPTKTGSVKAL